MGNISPLQRGFDLPKQSIVAGNIPIVYSNGILKFHNQSKSKAPGLVTGRSGTIGKFTFIENGEYWPHNTSLWVTDFCGNIPKFIYYLYQTINIEQFSTGSGVPTLNRNDVHRKKCSIPNIEEQKKISSFLSLLDEKLQTQRKIIESLESLMKGMSQKLFTQKLRFKEFTDEWKRKTLGEVLIKNSNKNKNQKYSTVQSVSNKYGFINQEEMFEDRRVASNNTSNYYIIEKGFFAYNPSRINVGSLAYKKDEEISVISPLYISFKANNIFLKDEFLWYWFKTIEFIRQMNNSFEGSVRNTLSYESLIKMNISIPCKEEQTKIADFLSKISDKIETEKKILELLEQQKKYFLQNMFI